MSQSPTSMRQYLLYLPDDLRQSVQDAVQSVYPSLAQEAPKGILAALIRTLLATFVTATADDQRALVSRALREYTILTKKNKRSKM